MSVANDIRLPFGGPLISKYSTIPRGSPRGAELRDVRRAATMTIAVAAKALRINHRVLFEIETGLRSFADASAYDEAKRSIAAAAAVRARKAATP